MAYICWLECPALTRQQSFYILFFHIFYIFYNICDRNSYKEEALIAIGEESRARTALQYFSEVLLSIQRAKAFLQFLLIGVPTSHFLQAITFLTQVIFSPSLLISKVLLSLCGYRNKYPIDVGYPSVCCKCILLPLVKKEVASAYGRADCSQVGKLN